METAAPDTNPPATPRPRSGLKTSTLVFLTILVTLAVAGGAMWWMLFGEFRPVRLSETEQARVEEKLARIGIEVGESRYGDEGRVEPYREAAADRRVRFTEREINGLIAHDAEMGRRLRIGFSEDLVTARVAIPLDEDFPFMGGKIVKFSAGLELAYAAGRPVVRLRGASLMGVPVPNAWLGGIKNVDLVEEFGDEGFWKAFAEGVESLRVGDGVIEVVLRE